MPNILFLNRSANRAVACANAASDALIRNLICHGVTSFFRNNIYMRSITSAKLKVNNIKKL